MQLYIHLVMALYCLWVLRMCICAMPTVGLCVDYVCLHNIEHNKQKTIKHNDSIISNISSMWYQFQNLTALNGHDYTPNLLSYNH